MQRLAPSSQIDTVLASLSTRPRPTGPGSGTRGNTKLPLVIEGPVVHTASRSKELKSLSAGGATYVGRPGGSVKGNCGLSKRPEVQYWNSAATRPWAELHEPIDRLFVDLTQAVVDLASGYVLGADISQQSVEKSRERFATAA